LLRLKWDCLQLVTLWSVMLYYWASGCGCGLAVQEEASDDLWLQCGSNASVSVLRSFQISKRLHEAGVKRFLQLLLQRLCCSTACIHLCDAMARTETRRTMHVCPSLLEAALVKSCTHALPVMSRLKLSSLSREGSLLLDNVLSYLPCSHLQTTAAMYVCSGQVLYPVT
jgi:hypothetical protein